MKFVIEIEVIFDSCGFKLRVWKGKNRRVKRRNLGGEGGGGCSVSAMELQLLVISMRTDERSILQPFGRLSCLIICDVNFNVLIPSK